MASISPLASLITKSDSIGGIKPVLFFSVRFKDLPGSLLKQHVAAIFHGENQCIFVGERCAKFDDSLFGLGEGILD
jgi:hypothetical protein